MLFYAVTAGLLFGLYFSLVGLGLNLAFGVMRIVNLAHGGVLMLGAFLASWLYRSWGVNPIFSVVAALILFTILGLPIYYLLVPRLMRARDPEMLSLILFFGLSQVIKALAGIAFGPNDRSIPGKALGVGPLHILGQTYPGSWLVAGGVGAALVFCVYVYLYRTRLGQVTRAIMAQRDEALATGVDVQKTSAIAFGISLGLAAAAGVMAPFMFGSFNVSMGHDINILAFVVIVIGSLGDPLGAVLGGLIYGVALMLMQKYLSSWANILPDLLLIAILLVRPSGLLGRRARDA